MDAVCYAAITGGQKTLKWSLLVCCRAEESRGPMQADRRHQCRGQRLIKQRGTFAPALLTNLSPMKMTAGRRDTALVPMLNLHLGYCAPSTHKMACQSIVGFFDEIRRKLWICNNELRRPDQYLRDFSIIMV